VTNCQEQVGQDRHRTRADETKLFLTPFYSSPRRTRRSTKTPNPVSSFTWLLMVPQSLLVSLPKGVVWIYPLLRALTEHGPWS